MRPLIAIALVLAAACGRGDRRDARDAHDAPSAPQSRAPDALVLRVPRAGGTARVLAYPRMDSVVWTAPDASPALERILAFDDDAGVVAAIDTRRRPVRIDLRAGAIARLANVPLASASSANADAVFGIDSTGTVQRHTPVGPWSFRPPRAAKALFAQQDGSLVILADHNEGSVLWRLRPPESRIVDSVVLPKVERSLPTPGSDRLYFATDDGLAAVRTRTLELRLIPIAQGIDDLVTTPSGDRIFLIGEGRGVLTVVDRYQDRVEREVTLPGPARSLRMDPLGRYLLVGDAGRDSVWIVAIGTGKVLGTVRSDWRADLPLVAADGAVALVQGNDVAWIDGETLRPISTVRGGAGDFWFAFRWNGFRPRDPALDEPVSFDDQIDSSALPGIDSAIVRVDTVRQRVDSAPPPSSGWSISFAALLSEERARELAGRIRVSGQSARVVVSNRDGASVYRVVMGPFTSREEAEQVARESRQPSYWIYEGAP